MSSNECFEAKITCKDDHVTVEIDEAHRQRAGIAVLEWQLCTRSDPVISAVGEPEEPITSDRGTDLETLEKDLERTRELRKKTELRLYALEEKHQLLGTVLFPTDDAINLRMAKEDLKKYDKEIRRLEAQIRSEKKPGSPDLK